MIPFQWSPHTCWCSRNPTCFSELRCGGRAGPHGRAGAQQAVPRKAVRAPWSTPSHEIRIVGVVRIVSLLSSQPFMVRGNEQCVKNFKEQEKLLLLLLLHYDYICLLLCYYITLLSPTTSHFQVQHRHFNIK